MTPNTPNTPNTLYLGLYESNEGSAACTGSLITAAGVVEPGVVEQWQATAWATLSAALEDAAIIGARHVIIVTNGDGAFRALRAPAHFRPDDQTQWQILRQLVTVQNNGGTWQIERVDEHQLTKAKELWQQKH